MTKPQHTVPQSSPPVPESGMNIQPNTDDGTRGINTPGFGDGSEADDFGAYRCTIDVNMTHRHLPGDFIRRDADGDHALIKWPAHRAMARVVERGRTMRAAYRVAEFPEDYEAAVKGFDDALDALRELTVSE